MATVDYPPEHTDPGQEEQGCRKSDSVVLGPYGLRRERESVTLLSSLARLVCEHMIRGTCWGLTRWSQVGWNALVPHT